MNQLLSNDLWPTLAALSKNHRRLWAAISYVTTTKYLDFRKGDVLVCDASDAAIKAGMTSASTLRKFISKEAKVYSFDGLHAKTFLIDGKAVIGSANLSENAGVNTCEAALLSDDLQIAALARGFIEQAQKAAKRVDENFLKRIEAIPVVRTGRMSKRNPKRVAGGISRLWLISTRPRRKKESSAEINAEKRGMLKAKKNLNRADYEIRTLRWFGISRFRKEAKPGDLVIEVMREKRGKRTFTEVYRAAPIIHRHDWSKWTWFYLETPPEDDVYYLWNEFKSDLVRLGFKNVLPNSTRELTERATQVLACLE
jgi:hypothetical protein